MKKYTHNLTGRERFIGFSTGDRDISIGYYFGHKIEGETTHTHTESDEIYVTVRGRGTIWIDGKIHGLKPGNPIRIEKGEPHRMLTVSKGPMELYALKIPDKSDDKVEVETPKELLELMEKHGLE